jgi:peptide subunit release factor 1 (eRF1)
MRRWLFFAVALPVAAWVLDRVANEIARKRGEGTVTHALRMPRARRIARRAHRATDTLNRRSGWNA